MLIFYQFAYYMFTNSTIRQMFYGFCKMEKHFIEPSSNLFCILQNPLNIKLASSFMAYSRIKSEPFG